MSGLPVLMETIPLEVALSGPNLTLVAIVGVVAVIALVMGGVFRREVIAANDGTEKMKVIAGSMSRPCSSIGMDWAWIGVGRE